MIDIAKIKEKVTQIALDNMVRKGHFNICAIRDIQNMNNTVGEAEALRILAPLHCVDFADMPKDVREALPDLIRRALGTSEMILSAPQRKGIFAKFTAEEEQQAKTLKLLTGS